MINRSGRVRTTVLTSAVIFLASSVFAGAKMDGAFMSRLKDHFKDKKAAVLLQGGLPSEAIGGNPSMRNSVGVKVTDGEKWEQKRFLGVKLDTSATLRPGEPLVIRKLEIKKDGVNIKTDTVYAVYSLEKTPKGEVNFLDRQGLDFEFRFADARLASSDENFAFISGAVEKYLKLFATEEEAIAYAEKMSDEAAAANATPPVQAADETAKLAQQIEALLGPAHYWNMDAVKDLRRDMPCSDVTKVYPTAKTSVCQADGVTFLDVPVKHPLVDKHQLVFKDARLRSVRLLFRKTLKKQPFKKASAIALQAKWGAKSPADIEEDVVVWSLDDGGAQRRHMVDHWEIENRLSKRPSVPLAHAPITTAEQLERKLAALLGSMHVWQTTPFQELVGGMSCERVSEVFETMDVATCNATDSARVEIPLAGDPLVSHFVLSFRTGRLREGTVVFQRYIKKALFHDVSSRLCPAKWGPKSPADLEDDVVTWVSGGNTAQRSFLYSWKIETEIPRPAR